MNDVKIEVRCDPSAEERDLIFKGLVEFNESRVGEGRFKEFGIFASAGDAIFLPLLLRLFMPCGGDLRLLVRGMTGQYYENMTAAIITLPEAHERLDTAERVPKRSGRT